MAITSGNDGQVFVDTDQVAEVKSFTIDETIDLLEGSAMGAVSKKYVDGLQDWSATVECWWDETDTNGQEAMTLGTTVTLNLYPEGSASGDTYATMSAKVESVSVAVSMSDVVSRTFTFKPADQTGITWGTVV